MSQRAARFVLGEVGRYSGAGHPLPQAIAAAKARAARQGYAVPVYRLDDAQHIADVFPCGQVDLTWEGSKIA